MLVIGNKIKFKAFSLIEIVVSLGIFSFIITAVITVAISLVRAETKIQAQLFLAQTAQTTLESMSRQIRYGYSYTGASQATYDNSEGSKTIVVNTLDVSNLIGSSASSTQILSNAENSPFILYEAQDGNPNQFSDQNAFCSFEGKLYKINQFLIQTDGVTYFAKCDTGSSMLPDNITLEHISYDVYGDNSENPKNPMVRIKMRLSHPEAGNIEVQTTVSQRLVTYF